jgi:ABC-2 type transport system ATP-binding protein
MIYVTRGSGRTIFFSSHLLDDVERVADHVAVLDRSVLRVVGPMEALTSSIREFHLEFGTAGAPLNLPPVAGLLSTRRVPGTLDLIVVRPTDDARARLRSLQPLRLEERPVAFADAIVSYLGDRGERRNLLDDAILSSAGGV